VTPASAVLSTTYTGYPASNCIDGSTSNFCHSGDTGGPEWLEIDLGSRQRVASIVVSNRAGYTDRIVDGTIGLYTASGGAGETCGSWTFEEDSASYTFDTSHPTPSPIFNPTPVPSSPFPTSTPTVKHTDPSANVRCGISWAREVVRNNLVLCLMLVCTHGIASCHTGSITRGSSFTHSTFSHQPSTSDCASKKLLRKPTSLRALFKSLR
jgi:hypothetical protein